MVEDIVSSILEEFILPVAATGLTKLNRDDWLLFQHQAI